MINGKFTHEEAATGRSLRFRTLRRIAGFLATDEAHRYRFAAGGVTELTNQFRPSRIDRHDKLMIVGKLLNIGMLDPNSDASLPARSMIVLWSDW